MSVAKIVLGIIGGISNGELRPALSFLRRPSYSQFGEDLALLQQAQFVNSGYYVDVGACHPMRYSNTYLYYLMGWQGLLIEPNPDLSSRLKRVRRRDTVIAQGISLSAKTLSYSKFERPEYNSFDTERLDILAEQGIRPIAQLTIQTMPLRDILAANGTPQDFELMSVDCEGMDAEVLQSNDWDRFRPRWIIIEDHEKGEAAESTISRLLSSLDYTARARLGYSYIYACRQAVAA